MSAALTILPMIWAFADPSRFQGSNLASSAAPDPLAPELGFYRKYTEAILRRYLRLSMEAGRAPSLLGREMFRGRVTSYKVHSFEDVVIFVHDVEKCLARLDPTQQQIIARIALQEYTLAETAELLRVPLRTVIRRYGRTLDRLTEILLEARLLEPMKSCQGAA